MRTQPQTELPIAAPVTPKVSNESTNRPTSRGEEPSFATTLDKSSRTENANRVADAKKTEPEQDQSDAPAKPILNSAKATKPSDDQAPQDSAHVAGENTLVSNTHILPDTILPEEIATELFSDPSAIVPLLQHLIAEPNNKIPVSSDDTALPFLSDLDLTLPLATAPIVNKDGMPFEDLNAIHIKTELPTANLPTFASTSATAPEQVNTDAANGTSNAATHIAPMITAVTAPITPQSKQQAKSAGEATILPTTTHTTATDVDATAGLPPIQANRQANDKDLSQQFLNKLVNREDQTASIPLSTSILSQATPATQSTDFHAIAKSLAGSDTKNVPDNKIEVAATQQRTVTEVPILSTAQPTSLAPTKINSEAVNAQPLLAQNGNAMEKAVTQQVQRALVQHLPTGERMMVLRMTPPELGTVRIEVIERNGVLSARLQAEDESVRVALERFLPGMRAELRSSDAPIREITLSDQAQFQRSFADGQQQQNPGQGNDSNRRPSNDGERFSLDTTRADAPLSPRIQVLGGQIGSTSINAFA
jgi:flagellar hook-length control protein FliK